MNLKWINFNKEIIYFLYKMYNLFLFFVPIALKKHF